MSAHVAALVGAGGFIGTLLRYGFNSGCAALFPAQGLSTILVNILGSFAAGWLCGWGLDKMSSTQSAFLITGVLGGFTTFSAFSLEFLILMKSGRIAYAFGYALITVIGGLCAAYAGFHAAH